VRRVHNGAVRGAVALKDDGGENALKVGGKVEAVVEAKATRVYEEVAFAVVGDVLVEAAGTAHEDAPRDGSCSLRVNEHAPEDRLPLPVVLNPDLGSSPGVAVLHTPQLLFQLPCLLPALQRHTSHTLGWLPFSLCPAPHSSASAAASAHNPQRIL